MQGNSNNPAQSIFIDGTGGGIFSTAEGTGAGGNTVVNANTVVLPERRHALGHDFRRRDHCHRRIDHGNHDRSSTMTSGASITAQGLADAGKIFIDAGQQFEMRDSSIATTATQASSRRYRYSSCGSRPSREQSYQHDCPQWCRQRWKYHDRSECRGLAKQPDYRASEPGCRRNITITTPLFLRDSSSPVSASSERGVNGTVTIQSRNAPISGHIQPLDKTPQIATSLLHQRCASLAGGESSSTVRDGTACRSNRAVGSPVRWLR